MKPHVSPSHPQQLQGTSWPTEGLNLAHLSGIAALPHLGLIRAVGVDSAAFLQGQLTQDVVSLGSNEARLAAFCSAKGRMQASFIVFKPNADEFLLLCSRDVLASTLKRLSMFVMRAKVVLSDASADVMVSGLTGSAVYSVDQHLGDPWSVTSLDGAHLIVLPSVGDIARALWCAPASSAPPPGTLAQPLDVQVWHWLSVRSGLAMVSQPVVDAFVPQMLNYESIGGVNFKKGCYPGQEVVARSQFRGTLKRRAYLVHGDESPEVGQDVYHESDAEQPCGRVAATAPHPAGGYDAIVSIQTSAASDAAAGQLRLARASGPALTLLPLPYPLLDDI